MLYLRDVASQLPAVCRSIADVAEDLRLSPQEITVFQKVYGLVQIAWAEDDQLAPMFADVIGKLLSASEIDRHSVRYIFHCHAAPCICPTGERLIADLKQAFGLRHAIAMGVAQDQCATPLTLLSIVDALLQNEPKGSCALILCGELGLVSRMRVIPNTTISGDAVAACLVSNAGERNQMIAAAQRKFEVAEVQPTAAHIPVPTTSYGDDLIQVVSEALKNAALTMDDIALVLGHNVNSISWKFFARNFPCPLEKLYLGNIAKNGHCFTADPFINYCDAVAEGRLRAGDHFLMVSVGTTSSFAAVVLRH